MREKRAGLVREIPESRRFVRKTLAKEAASTAGVLSADDSQSLAVNSNRVGMTYRHSQTMKIGTAGVIMVRARFRINVVLLCAVVNA
jgi:hypothetical protein